MRKALVVLVPLFIVLSSGFIVPQDSSENKDNSTNGSNHNKSDNNPGGITLENSNKIDEKELFTENKKNNVNERSLLYLNQKFGSPVNSKYYPLNTKIPSMFQNSFKTFLIPNQKSPQEKNIVQKDQYQPQPQLANDQLFMPNSKKNSAPRYVPSVYRYSYPRRPLDRSYYSPRGEKSAYTDEDIEKPEVNDERQQISEPISKPDEKTNYLPTRKNIVSNVGTNSGISPGSRIKKIQRITSYIRHKSRKNYNCGFSHPGKLHRSSYNKNGLPYNPGLNLDNAMTDSLTKSNPFIDDDDDKLERYIKETLEENGLKELLEEGSFSHDNFKREKDDKDLTDADDKNVYSTCDAVTKKGEEMDIVDIVASVTTKQDIAASFNENDNDVPKINKL